ncbi:MAG: hypothetical protein HKUEN02_11110 [Anaerolineaceae bacterium]|nr:MAG: hypothetical protein HKUEN02_11110 [Anaerolineaceae bacterium]HRQ32340.1 diguanylate cyclase [Anaerolineales bacterium]
MKVLVLNNDLVARAVIQQTLQASGHEAVGAEDSDTALFLLKNGEFRFIIADYDNTDGNDKGFIHKARNIGQADYAYILLIVNKTQAVNAATSHLGADDYLSKPIVPAELKLRVSIGERILALGDNLVHAKETLDHLAMVDVLTGALNRIAFMIFSRGELERARRAQASLSLIAFNVDNFKAINEKYGRDVGNDALTVIAQGIREKSRPYDGLGRLDADVFMLILPGVIGADAEKIAARIIKSIANTQISLLDGAELKVNVRAGIASSSRVTVSTEMDALIERANEAVAMAKREDGDQIYTIYV